MHHERAVEKMNKNSSMISKYQSFAVDNYSQNQVVLQTKLLKSEFCLLILDVYKPGPPASPGGGGITKTFYNTFFAYDFDLGLGSTNLL